MQQKLKSLLVIFLLLTTGCDNDIAYRYFTRINPDGTIFKRITAVGDSASIYAHPFPFEISNGWLIKYGKETRKTEENKTDTVYLATAEKTFPSLDDVQQAFSHQIDSIPKENILFERISHFRWFYTYTTYRETFKQRFPFRHFPITNYLSANELSFFIYEDTTTFANLSKHQRDSLIHVCENKGNQFLNDNALHEILIILDQYTDSLKVAKISTATRDTMRKHFEFLDDHSWDQVLTKIDSLEHRDVANNALKEGKFKQFVQLADLDNWISSNGSSYNSEIEVPGLLYSTNGKPGDKNTVRWQFDGDYFTYNDYVMEVQYRTTNTWAFVISALTTLVLIWFLFIRKDR
jgi:hypothetical protein